MFVRFSRANARLKPERMTIMCTNCTRACRQNAQFARNKQKRSCKVNTSVSDFDSSMSTNRYHGNYYIMLVSLKCCDPSDNFRPSNKYKNAPIPTHILRNIQV